MSTTCWTFSKSCRLTTWEQGVWPHCFGWSCEIRWKDLKHPELHPKATDELMPCDFQNDCSGLWCLWHILWIKALRNTNNVLNGNTKVGICKRFRTFRLLFSQELTEMGPCNERFFSVVCMKEMFDPSSDFRSRVSPCFRWMMLTSSSSSLTRWRWGLKAKKTSHLLESLKNQVVFVPTLCQRIG